ncbi:MAG: PP2C family protein-serine/threonine phosphatase [Planctomycetota bacterium]|nr:PP2C family protein-serine/threonine phosphatase [Planctomycetota bacterium]
MARDRIARSSQAAYREWMETGSWLKLYGAIFFIFAPMLLIFFGRFAEEWSVGSMVFWVIASGLLGMGYAYAFTSRIGLLAVVIPANIALVLISVFNWPPGLALSGAQPTLEGIAVVTMIVIGYIFFVRFIAGEGARTVRLQTEMDLAREIHASLVPPIELKEAWLEASGRSEPSAEMGGDLLDVVRGDGRIDFYVADVSGHGVRAGVLMAMIKSAIRTRLLSGAELEEVQRDLNLVIEQVKQEGMFATFACVRLRADSEEVEYAVAGHLPILHWRKSEGRVGMLGSESLPLGVLEDERFVAKRIRVEAGDALALLTDGVTEVFDGGRRQFGVEGAVAALESAGGRSPQEIHRAIIDGSIAHGGPGAEQHDDRTLLVVRRL